VAARINLSIPDELKERMDKLADVNWSKVAQDSFETQIIIYELKEKNMTTAAGLQRLRASKKTNTQREEAEGIAAGKKWAIEHAEYDELMRVSNLDTSNEINSMELAQAVINDDGASGQEVVWCLERLFGATEPSVDLIAGFVQGAREVFREV
jgi:hypothetical protein